MKWYYVVNKERIGPVEDDEFRQLVDSGTVTFDTLVWNQSLKDWQTFGNVVEASGQEMISDTGPEDTTDDHQVDSGISSVYCSECGKSFPEDELITYETSKICASCKPVFVQKIKEGIIVGGVEYGGFWIRLGATVIDSMIMWVVNMILWIIGMFALFPMVGFGAFEDPENMTSFFILQGIMYLLQFALHITYQTWFLGRFGATPGKMICGLEVVTGDRGKISYLRAFGRYFAEMLNAFTLGLTYLMVAFDAEKRGLHDRICYTLVVKKSN